MAAHKCAGACGGLSRGERGPALGGCGCGCGLLVVVVAVWRCGGERSGWCGKVVRWCGGKVVWLWWLWCVVRWCGVVVVWCGCGAGESFVVGVGGARARCACCPCSHGVGCLRQSVCGASRRKRRDVADARGALCALCAPQTCTRVMHFALKCLYCVKTDRCGEPRAPYAGSISA